MTRLRFHRGSTSWIARAWYFFLFAAVAPSWTAWTEGVPCDCTILSVQMSLRQMRKIANSASMYFFSSSFVRMAAPAPPTARSMSLKYSSSKAANEMSCREYTTQRACAENARCRSETAKRDGGGWMAAPPPPPPAPTAAGAAERVALSNMEWACCPSRTA